MYKKIIMAGSILLSTILYSKDNTKINSNLNIKSSKNIEYKLNNLKKSNNNNKSKYNINQDKLLKDLVYKKPPKSSKNVNLDYKNTVKLNILYDVTTKKIYTLNNLNNLKSSKSKVYNLDFKVNYKTTIKQEEKQIKKYNKIKTSNKSNNNLDNIVLFETKF